MAFASLVVVSVSHRSYVFILARILFFPCSEFLLLIQTHLLLLAYLSFYKLKVAMPTTSTSNLCHRFLSIYLVASPRSDVSVNGTALLTVSAKSSVEI